MIAVHRRLGVLAAALAFAGSAAANSANSYFKCGISESLTEKIQATLAGVVTQKNGGIFSPNRMWSAVVDREGKLCSIIKIGDAWPGSRAIAIAKASTANDFSNDGLSLSTANLYASTQPGGSLYGLNNSNPFNPDFLEGGAGHGEVVGGIITFGGGLALYQNGQVIGGLGVSGDSSCTDHVIAYRMRKLVGLDKIPAGVGFNGTDDLIYPAAGAAPTGFEQPHCFPTDLAPGTY